MKPDVDDLVIRMEKEIAIKGTVTDAETGNPLKNATIHHFNADHPMIVSSYSNRDKIGTGSVQSGSDGPFSIGGNTGENILYVEHPQYAPSVIGPVEVKSGGEKPSVIAKLREGGKVSGYVRSGTKSVSGHTIELKMLDGIPNLEIKEDHEVFNGEGLFAYANNTTINDAGYFEFKNLMPGEYRLSQMINGEGFSSSVRITKIQISEGETTSLTLGGSGGAKLHGKVINDHGNPIKDATVRVRVEDDPLHSGGTDITNSSGYYEIMDLPPGMHQLTATKIEPCPPGEVCPMPMRFTGIVEVSEGVEEIKQNIKMTGGGVAPPNETPKVSKKYASPDVDISGEKITLPEDTAERFPEITNFEDTFTGWTKWGAKDSGWAKWGIEDEKSAQTCEIVYDKDIKSNVLEFKRTNGGSQGSMVGLAHNVYITLSKYDELYLQMDMKPIYQSLIGGGWAGGGEYPVNVELTFIDEKGTGYRWRHGVYYKGESSYISSSTKVAQDQWHTYTSSNLKEMIPICADEKLVKDGGNYGREYHEYNPPITPKIITRILIFGGGWDFIGRADNIQFRTSR